MAVYAGSSWTRRACIHSTYLYRPAAHTCTAVMACGVSCPWLTAMPAGPGNCQEHRRCLQMMLTSYLRCSTPVGPNRVVGGDIGLHLASHQRHHALRMRYSRSTTVKCQVLFRAVADVSSAALPATLCIRFLSDGIVVATISGCAPERMSGGPIKWSGDVGFPVVGPSMERIPHATITVPSVTRRLHDTGTASF